MGLAPGKSPRQFSDALRAERGLCQKKWQLVPLGLEMVSGLVYTLDESDVHEKLGLIRPTEANAAKSSWRQWGLG